MATNLGSGRELRPELCKQPWQVSVRQGTQDGIDLAWECNRVVRVLRHEGFNGLPDAAVLEPEMLVEVRSEQILKCWELIAHDAR